MVRVTRMALLWLLMADSKWSPSFGSIQVRLGRSIRATRTSRNMTQETLAAAVGIGSRHLQKIEAGEVNVTLSTICRIASVLAVDPGSLLQENQK